MAELPPSEPLICSRCSAENRADARFCGSCGSRLVVTIECGVCGTENSAEQRFCDECGAPLERVAPAVSQKSTEPDERDERKQVTVLFADVRGSMELAGQVSSERLREIMNGLFTRLAAAVTHYGGTVDKFTGDGIMAVFGAPIALEDHALRACLTASEMRDAAQTIATDLAASEGIDFALRVGLNSGEVVAGSIGPAGIHSYTAVGQAVGLAQRVESLAEPGGVWMSESTARQIEGKLTIESAGEHIAKGVDQPLKTFRLLEATDELLDAPLRFGERAPIVGRADEVAELRGAVDRLADGAGSLIGIVGSPGIGKSRLTYEVALYARECGIPVFSTRSLSHARDVSLRPLLRLMRSYFSIEDSESPELSRQKISERMLGFDPAFESVLPLLYDFLGVPDTELALPEISADARKRRLMAAIGQISRVRKEPVVLIVEDLHWCDPESEAFFEVLADSTAASPTLFVGTFRPEFRGALLERANYRQLPVTPLLGDEIRRLLDSMLGDDPSLDGLAERVAERSGGNPFFAEEIVRDLAEAGYVAGTRGDYRLAASIDSVGAPSSVQAVLGARIDRLGPDAKAVLMTASVIGAEFRYDLLAKTVEISPEELATALHELIQAEFIEETDLFPVAKYSFRHPLTHDVAYESQLAASRAETHAEIAQAMQSIEVDRLEENAAIVAQHYEAAGDLLNAAVWHARAAAWALRTDPVATFDSWMQMNRCSKQALEGGLDADDLYAASIWMLLLSGWRLAKEESVMKPLFDEACEIARRNNDDVYLSRIYATYTSTVGFSYGDFPEAARLGVESRRLARGHDDPIIRVGALMSQPFTALNIARYSDALEGCDAVLEELGGDPERGSFMINGASPLAFHHGARAVALTHLGRCAEARESISAARSVADHHIATTLAWTHIYNFWSMEIGRDFPTADVLRDAEDALALSDEIGDVFTRSNTYLCGGGVIALSGDLHRAIDLYDAAVEMFTATGVVRNTEMYLAMLRGSALCRIGDVDAGLAQAKHAVDLADRYGLSLLAITARTSYAECLLASADGPGIVEATRQLREAERLLVGSESEIDRIDVLRVRAQLHNVNGEPERGEMEHAKAVDFARAADARGLLAVLGEPVATSG